MTDIREDRNSVRSSYKAVQLHHGPLVRKWACLRDPRIRSYCERAFEAAWTVSKVTITWASLTIEKNCDFGAPNDKCGYRFGTILSFQVSSGSARNILMAVYVYDTEETACRLLAFDIGVGVLHLV
ncbi:hypothetical protein HNY73_016033 [Argiope bruennichi]|uniref:Uncharacterized protein n=1 Tax=Argiope bruennichi TaxID=94029 RepID=A0A8T0EH78_ARGBR|nr:hypothetical protein HNY73_016033 [Argiope bruennichi]